MDLLCCVAEETMVVNAAAVIHSNMRKLILTFDINGRLQCCSLMYVPKCEVALHSCHCAKSNTQSPGRLDEMVLQHGTATACALIFNLATHKLPSYVTTLSAVPSTYVQTYTTRELAAVSASCLHYKC